MYVYLSTRVLVLVRIMVLEKIIMLTPLPPGRGDYS